jgi:hypothetical protein
MFEGRVPTPTNSRESLAMSTTSTEWYWDLQKGKAVPAAERGHGDHMLGPYATKGEAENWKSQVETRNKTWDDADKEWNSWGDEGDADET